MSDNVIPLGAKPDRLANQLAMHEAMKDELLAVAHKFEAMGLLQIFLNDACAEVSAEIGMGPLVMIFDGEPA